MMPGPPLTCWGATPVCSPVSNRLIVKGFLPVWVWLIGKGFKGCAVSGDRMSGKCQFVTNCQSVSDPFLNSVRKDRESFE